MVPNQSMLLLAGLAAGVIAPFLVQIFKGRLKGLAALFLAYAVCLIVGLVIAVVGGAPLPPLDDPIAFLAAAAELTGVANLIAKIIYKAWLEKWATGIFANRIKDITPHG